ncbi:glycosyltransferase family 2 protein [Patescibacteria group bacterium]|nr:glycosyltransferase family 2 protein [Patescibacteria group bacterium]
MELSIIIVSYKMSGLIKNCIKTILESALDFSFEIIVVDNGSQDNIADMMKKNYSSVKLILSEKNRGMGAGNNLGIKEAKGKYILVMNPDIFVFKDSLKKLIEFIKQKPDIGLVAPRLLNPDRTLQYTCYRRHNFLTPLYRRTFFGKFSFGKREIDRFLMSDFDHASTREVDWIQGSCVLVPREVFDEVGLFDERFFMYFEDTDLCRRIKLAGYKNIYFAGAEVIHLHTRQSGGGMLQIFSNKLTRTHILSWLKYWYKWGIS